MDANTDKIQKAPHLWKPGQSGNPAGKPKGANNKTTKDLQKFITNFLNEKAFEIPLIWDTLDDKDKATLFLHLSKLVMPKQMTDAEQETGIRPIILNLGSGLNPDAETID
jgi:hypothetical protein